jgi:hypothetical protein
LIVAFDGGAFGLKVGEERRAKITAIRTASLEEFEEGLIILQCSLLDATQTNDFHSLGNSTNAIKKAQDAILVAMESDPLDVKLVPVAVETTDRVHTVQECTLKRLNDPAYDSAYTRLPYVC